MLKVESCVCGFCVYGAQWTPRNGENLQCAREPGNKVGPFAVAVKSGSGAVGYVHKRSDASVRSSYDTVGQYSAQLSETEEEAIYHNVT